MAPAREFKDTVSEEEEEEEFNTAALAKVWNCLEEEEGSRATVSREEESSDCCERSNDIVGDGRVMVQLIFSAGLLIVAAACPWCGLPIWMIRLLELSLLATLFIIEIVGGIRLSPGGGRNGAEWAAPIDAPGEGETLW